MSHANQYVSYCLFTVWDILPISVFSELEKLKGRVDEKIAVEIYGYYDNYDLSTRDFLRFSIVH